MRNAELTKKELKEPIDVTIGRVRTAIAQATTDKKRERALNLFNHVVTYMDSIEEFLPIEKRRGF